MTGCLNARTLIDLAETCLVSGDKTKPGEYSQKAVEAAAGESAAISLCRDASLNCNVLESRAAVRVAAKS